MISVKKMAEFHGPSEGTTFLETHFSELQDPRRTNKGNLRHRLIDVIFLTVSAILCGAEDWETVKLFGDYQKDWLKSYGGFDNGIPSEDTIGRVFAALDPKSFNSCFIDWVNSISKISTNEVVAIDGKSIRGANPKKNGNKMPHIVSAFAAENGLCLGQVKVNEKSNEITAIPDLLKILAVEGCIVTIDAMGCQTGIASNIIDKKANYILAVKGNQSNLGQAIKDTVRLEKPESINIQDDFGHGRIEKRTCMAYSDLSHLGNNKAWDKLKTIIKIESEVFDKKSKQTTTEQRYYISSLPADAELLNKSIRNHWAVENNLHWTLDVEFGEDKSRKRKGYAAENHNIILKTAMILLSNDKTKKLSKKNKRMKAALNAKYRDSLFKS